MKKIGDLFLKYILNRSMCFKNRKITGIIFALVMMVLFVLIPSKLVKADNAIYTTTTIEGVTLCYLTDNDNANCVDISLWDLNGSVSVTIPETINGKTVIKIRIDAFANCTNLENIKIPNTITSIDKDAFVNCTKLQSITIPDSVTSIGIGAFDGCTSLKSIIIPNSVTSISDCTFNNCTSLQSIIMPDSVTSIGGIAFNGCTSLQSISIPDSVTSIGSGAFQGCTGLQSIVIPSSVTNIYDYAFYYCTNLHKVTLSSTTTIGNGAFENCPSNRTVTTYGANNTTNTEPTFADTSNTLTINKNAPAQDVKSLLTVYDKDINQNETWEIKTPPSHGTLSGFPAVLDLGTVGSTNAISASSALTYKPTTGYTGNDSFTIKVSDGFSGPNNDIEKTINVTVNGSNMQIYSADRNIHIPNGDTSCLSTNGTYFGSCNIGEEITKTFTIKNDGNADLDLGNCHISFLPVNQIFYLKNAFPSGTLNPGKTATFTIGFSPTVAGAVNTYQVKLTDPDGNEYTFKVEGYCMVITSSFENTSVSYSTATFNCSKFSNVSTSDIKLQQLDNSNNWQDVTSGINIDDSGSDYKIKVKNLTPNTAYKFRLVVGGGTQENGISDVKSLTTKELPSISSVSIPTDGTYKAGDELNFKVTFTGDITVGLGSGSCKIPITIGNTTKYANYTSGSGTNTLIFKYTISYPDLCTDGIRLGNSILFDNGAIIPSDGESSDVIDLTLTSPTTSSILIDSIPPYLYQIFISKDKKKVTLSFTKDIKEAVLGSLTASTQSSVKLSKDGGTSFETLDNASISISGNKLIITFNSPLTGSQNKIKLDGSSISDMVGNVQTNDIIPDALGTSVTMFADKALNEGNLDGRTLTLNINGDSFKNTVLDKNNFIINNPPIGLSISNVTYMNTSNCLATLQYNGHDFDESINNFSITIKEAEFVNSCDTTSNNLVITAESKGAVTTITPSASNIHSSGVLAEGNLTSIGTGNVSEMGIVYSNSADPTLSDTKVTASRTSMGTYSVSLTGLTQNSTYHMRAYVTNEDGTSYGNDVSFTTAAYSTTLVNNSKTETTASFSLAGVLGASEVKLEQRLQGSSTWEMAVTTGSIIGIIPSGKTSAEVIGLTAGNNYEFRLLVTGGMNAGTSNVVTVAIKPLSTVNSLSNLTVNQGSLNPNFDATVPNYAVNVGSSVTSINVKPTAADITASIKINGIQAVSGTTSSAINLNVGDNTINIEVTAQNGSVKTYSIIVNRSLPASTVNSLSDLTVDQGLLNPNFDASITSYTVDVVNSVTSIVLTPTAITTTASIKINGIHVNSGTTSSAINLNVGDNKINIEVTSQSGVSKAYTVTVTRQAQVPTVIPVTAITLDCTDKTMFINDSFKLTAAVTPENAQNKTIIWKSSNNSVAAVDNISGLVAAKTAGNAIITAETVDGGYKASCSITVKAYQDNSKDVRDHNKSDSNTTASNTSATQTGAAANTGVQQASGTTYGTKITDSKKEVKVEGLSTDKTNLIMDDGSTVQLTLNIAPKEASNKAVKWTSSDESVATVDSNGKVTAVSDGPVTITAAALDGNFSQSFNVNVEKPETPSVTFVGIEHSPLVEGDTESFYLSSEGQAKVQYRVFLYSEETGTTEEITDGYTKIVDSYEPYKVSSDKKFKVGQYKLITWVRGEDSKEEYDSTYTSYLNCAPRDDANRVYSNGSMDIAKTDYKLGETIKITGIEGLSGIPGPYKYRLHVYDAFTNKWIKDVTAYGDSIEWTPEEPGNYVLDVHIDTPNSSTWDNYLDNPNSENLYGTYEAWKLKAIKVES